MVDITTPEAKLQGRNSQQYTYDAEGNITGVIDGNGNNAKYTLDLWGKIISITEPDGINTKYDYDYAGNLISTTDGNGNTTRYTYNSLNLMSEIIDPLGRKITFKYDRQGRIVQRIGKDGRSTYYTYNADNNITSRWEEEGQLEKYEYNIDGSLAASISGTTIHTYTYTPAGRLKSKATNGQKVLQYDYNKNGLISRLTDISGTPVDYTYDVLGRVTEVSNGGKISAKYEYNIDNTIAQILYGSGVCAKYEYNLDKNITRLLNMDPSGKEIFTYKYAYDGNGNQILKEENDKVTAYSYDALNRLEEVIYPGQVKERFTYDANGNRLKREFGDIWEHYEYDNCNRLIQRIKNGLITEYEYDERGNLIREKDGQLNKLYSYDGFDRLTHVKNSDGTYMENIYDAENLRSISIENGKYNRYVYSGSSIACEVDEDWGLKDRVVRGHTILQREDSNKDTYYYIHNAHGDITALTDGTGEVVNNYSYDAFGNILDSVEKVDNRFKYSGELHDPVTDQYYLRARYYNPSIGRFMQEDTFRGDGLNLYTYVSNNPIKYIDPTGHCKEGVNFSDGSGNILGTNLDNVIKKIPLIERILGYFNNVEVGNTYNVESEFLSDEYFDELNALYSKVKKENNKWGIFGNGKEIAAEAVINQMMDDLEANPDALVGNANYKRFFDTFDQNITQLDSITERMHYFRNTLNSYGGAPTDLEGMIEMAAKGEWELFSTIGTAYHRYDYDGVQGALNVKFVSADGRFEAVYNTGTGKMVTDPANMGTYNYAPASSVVGFFKHNKCDVEPFEKWGNTSELSYEDIKNLKSGHMTITAHTNHNTVKELIKMRKKELTTEK